MKRKYTYKSAASKLAAQARGRNLQARLTLEQKRDRFIKMQRGLEIYREAEKISKTDTAYNEYWKEIKKLRKQAKKFGKTLGLSNVTGAPEMLRGRNSKLEARVALGLASKIDAESLFNELEKASIIFNDTTRGTYIYDGKSYSKEDLLFMLSSPQKFFPSGSPIWNHISELYHTVGDIYVSEIFGS